MISIDLPRQTGWQEQQCNSRLAELPRVEINSEASKFVMGVKSNSIKVVKRKIRESKSQCAETPVTRTKSDRQYRRELLKTVTSWIEESRERKRNGHPVEDRRGLSWVG